MSEQSDLLVQKDDENCAVFFERLNTLRKSDGLSDIAIMTDDAQFSAHKIVLAASSDFFLQKFNEFSNCDHLKLPDCPAEIFAVILDYIYTQKLQVKIENVARLIKWAHFFKISKLQTICASYLIDHLCFENIQDVKLLAASNANQNAQNDEVFVKLNDCANQFIQQNFQRFAPSGGLLKIKVDVIVEKIPKCEFQLELSRLVIDWLESVLDNNSAQLADLKKQTSKLFLTPNNSLVEAKHLDRQSVEQNTLIKDCILTDLNDSRRFTRNTPPNSISAPLSTPRQQNSTQISPDATARHELHNQQLPHPTSGASVPEALSSSSSSTRSSATSSAYPMVTKWHRFDCCSRDAVVSASSDSSKNTEMSRISAITVVQQAHAHHHQHNRHGNTQHHHHHHHHHSQQKQQLVFISVHLKRVDDIISARSRSSQTNKSNDGSTASRVAANQNQQQQRKRQQRPISLANEGGAGNVQGRVGGDGEALHNCLSLNGGGGAASMSSSSMNSASDDYLSSPNNITLDSLRSEGGDCHHAATSDGGGGERGGTKFWTAAANAAAATTTASSSSQQMVRSSSHNGLLESSDPNHRIDGERGGGGATEHGSSVCSSAASTHDVSLTSPPPIAAPPSSSLSSLSSSAAATAVDRIAMMKTPRSAAGVALIGDLVWLLGGYNRGECLKSSEFYSPAQNAWFPGPPLPEPRSRMTTFCLPANQTITVGNAETQFDLYVVGGSNGSREMASVLKYTHTQPPHCAPSSSSSSSSPTWTRMANLNQARSGHSGCQVGSEQLWVVGGACGQTYLRSVEMLDLRDAGGVGGEQTVPRWKMQPEMYEARSQAAVAYSHGRIYVIGGCDRWNALCSGEVFDLRERVWRALPPLPNPRRGAALIPVQGGRLLYLVGGSDGRSSLANCDVYDVAAACWCAGPPLNHPRANAAIVLLSCVRRSANQNATDDDADNATARDSTLLAIGGFNGKHFLDTAEMLRVDTHEWSLFVTSSASPPPPQSSQSTTGMTAKCLAAVKEKCEDATQQTGKADGK